MQILGETIGDVKRVADMHERKSEMAKNADAFIALPGETQVNYLSTSETSRLMIPKLLGGYGTMEELLEIVAWSQLGIHHKPVSNAHNSSLSHICTHLYIKFQQLETLNLLDLI